MINGKYDVTPSVDNAGLTIRCSDQMAQIQTMKADKQEQEIARLNAVNAASTTKHLARLSDYNARDLHTVTQNGLPLVGPASGDANSVMALAFNHAMVLVDAKITELESKIAQLSASK